MAVTSTALSTEIQSQLRSKFSIPAFTNPDNAAEFTKFCDAIAAAVATVLVRDNVVTVVTSCNAGAGTGTGKFT